MMTTDCDYCGRIENCMSDGYGGKGCASCLKWLDDRQNDAANATEADYDDCDDGCEDEHHDGSELADLMDGDHETGLASAGFGTDEDYGGWDYDGYDEW